MNNKVEKYILYGASFNPPHVGHFSAISQMLEEYDKVIVFPYPKKFVEGTSEELPPISQRLKMLQIFAEDFFPQMADRLIIVNLSAEMQKQQKIDLTEAFIKNMSFLNAEENQPVKERLHTYDYLNFVKSRLPENAELTACLGFESQNIARKEDFFNEEKIKQEFPHFYLQEETTIKSEELRSFFSNHKNIKFKKDEQYIQSRVGNGLASYIFENQLYGLKAKIEQKPKKMKP